MTTPHGGKRSWTHVLLKKNDEATRVHGQLFYATVCGHCLWKEATANKSATTDHSNLDTRFSKVKLHTATRVGRTNEMKAHFLLPVSLSTVKTVVPQGK